MRTVLVALVMIAVGCSQQARPEPASPSTDAVVWSVEMPSHARAIAGSSLNVTLTAKIGRGWHMYAMTQQAGGPSAMKVGLPAAQPFSFDGPVVEPEPKKGFDQNFNLETRFFETTATFTLPVKIAADTSASVHPLMVEVEYQACSERQCQPPAKASLTIDVITTRLEGPLSPEVFP